jgi:spermidine synthase
MYFVVDGTRYIESRWDMSHPQSLDLDYSRTMMAGFMINPAPKRLMMMGLGGGQITNYLFERFPELEIDAVDIDPEVVRLAVKYFGVPEKDPRYRLHVGDGRVFIEKGETPWDMIMLDAFRGVFVPYHLKTLEFYQACLRQLSPGGVVVANLHNLTRMYPYDRTTLAEAFPQQYAFVSEAGNQTTFVASASPERVGTYAIRANAHTVQAKFDFDVSGLAARNYLHADWDEGLRVLKDDFKLDELEGAAARHNTTCIRGCAYPTR